MDAEQARSFTLTRLFFGDMLLNWLIGAALLALPAWVDGLLGYASLLPLWVYRLIGGGFVLFAGWQTWVVIRRDLGVAALFFASALAVIPFILLAAALLLMDFPLRTGWRVVLWVGNIYMLALGLWYAYVARLLLRPRGG